MPPAQFARFVAEEQRARRTSRGGSKNVSEPLQPWQCRTNTGAASSTRCGRPYVQRKSARRRPLRLALSFDSDTRPMIARSGESIAAVAGQSGNPPPQGVPRTWTSARHEGRAALRSAVTACLSKEQSGLGNRATKSLCTAGSTSAPSCPSPPARPDATRGRCVERRRQRPAASTPPGTQSVTLTIVRDMGCSTNPPDGDVDCYELMWRASRAAWSNCLWRDPRRPVYLNMNASPDCGRTRRRTKG